MTIDLPHLVSLDNEDDMMKQVFFSDTANWIVPNMIMVGETPAKASSVTERMKSLRSHGGITTFLCLQAEVHPQAEGFRHVHFGGIEDGDEMGELPSYAEAARQVENSNGEEPTFLYYGIRDMEEALTLNQLIALIEDLVKRVKDGEVLYIHCKGGMKRLCYSFHSNV